MKLYDETMIISRNFAVTWVYLPTESSSAVRNSIFFLASESFALSFLYGISQSFAKTKASRILD